jgi:hypothetical protein
VKVKKSRHAARSNGIARRLLTEAGVKLTVKRRDRLAPDMAILARNIALGRVESQPNRRGGDTLPLKGRALMAEPLRFWSLAETARHTRRRKVSAVEVTQVLLASVPAHRLDETPRTSQNVAEVGRFRSPVNLATLPALSVPCGHTKGNPPAGMQLIGRTFEKATLIRIGSEYQQDTDWHSLHPESLQ